MREPDFLAFSLIVFFAVRARREAGGFKIPMILQTIAEDSTRYFLVIFTSHFVLMMTLLFARVGPTPSFSLGHTPNVI
jgi:hypothetical protein